jgi:hypothetical protein
MDSKPEDKDKDKEKDKHEKDRKERDYEKYRGIHITRKKQIKGEKTSPSPPSPQKAPQQKKEVQFILIVVVI